MSPYDKITYGTNIYGSTVHVGRRTGAHLDYTKMRLAFYHPGCKLLIIQGAFNTGVEASAGTHDYDACLDVKIDGMNWWDAQKFLRQCGWAAWYRHPPTFPLEHVHMVSLGYGAAKVGEFIPGQVTDYYNHAYGLKGQHNSGADPSWFPNNIAATIFDYKWWISMNPVQMFRYRIGLALNAEDIPTKRTAARIMVRAIKTALAVGPRS